MTIDGDWWGFVFFDSWEKFVTYSSYYITSLWYFHFSWSIVRRYVIFLTIKRKTIVWFIKFWWRKPFYFYLVFWKTPQIKKRWLLRIMVEWFLFFKSLKREFTFSAFLAIKMSSLFVTVKKQKQRKVAHLILPP